MKQLTFIFRAVFLILACTLALPAYSQGVAVYKKDGTMVKYAYEEIDSIVTYNYGEEPVAPFAPEAIDLGLPSGIKWASFNVGATKPEEYGGYYAWGETEEKDDYSLSTYKWCNGSHNTMTKYCTDSDFGTVDNRTVLDPEDDVAHVNWGGNWRMPTKAEQDELRNNCTWEWTTLNGVNGYKVTGSNGNSIFLPAAGYRSGTDVNDGGNFGYYWSSSLRYDSNDGAGYLGFYDNGYSWYYDSRFLGLSVRPVSE